MGKTRTGSRRHYEGLASPSSSIRLLTFNPLHGTHLFDYTLKSYDLDSCPPYVALSYEWGEVEPQVEVMINGVPSLIRHNLSLFLSVLHGKMKQAKMERKTLSHDVCPWVDAMWIDAICIDQEDLSERNAQVSIMGQIYQRAALVFAWLGWPQGWDPKLTFEFIGRHFKDWSIQSDSKMLQMVLQMCRCRYWSRRWIVQEVLLARDVTIVCGEYDLSWSDLRRFSLRYLNSLNRYEFDSPEGLDKTIPFIMSRHRGVFANEVQKVSTMRELLVDFSGTDCEVFHDKVYSLLSLASDGDKIAVDYGCLPQELFYRILPRGRWWHNELQLLAEDLGIPTPLPNRIWHFDKVKASESVALAIEEEFAITHQIRLCSTPLSLPKREWQSWRADVKLRLLFAEASRNLVDLPGFFETVCPFEPCRPTAHCGYDDDDKQIFQRKSPEPCGQFDKPSGRLVTCNDGTVGLTCTSARAGDLLCDFTPGTKVIIREDHENTPCLVGTATLLGALPAFAELMHKVQQVSELVLQRLRDFDLPQLGCTTDGSTSASGLSTTERAIISDRLFAGGFSTIERRVISDWISTGGLSTIDRRVISDLISAGDLSTIERRVISDRLFAGDLSTIKRRVISDRLFAGDLSTIKRRVISDRLFAGDLSTIERRVISDRISAGGLSTIERRVISDWISAGDLSTIKRRVISDLISAGGLSRIERAIISDRISAGGLSMIERAIISDQISAGDLSTMKRGIISDRISALTNFVSLLEANQFLLTSHERMLPKQTIKGSFNMWDLIALETSGDRLVSIELTMEDQV
jgi:hypothetical protein